MPHPAPHASGRVRAFTLVELLSVLAVIGVLTAILIPIVGTVRASARSTQCLTNIRAIGVASLSYGADNKLATPNYSDHHTLATGQARVWYLQIAPYLGADLTNTNSVRTALRSFVCPSSLRSRDDGQTEVPWNGTATSWPYISDYGYNSAVNNGVTPRLTRFTDPVNPAQTPLIHEIVSQNNFYGGCFNFPRFANDREAFTAGYRQAFTQRHNGGGYILWFDGSMKWMKYDDYMALARRTTPFLFVTGGG